MSVLKKGKGKAGVEVAQERSTTLTTKLFDKLLGSDSKTGLRGVSLVPHTRDEPHLGDSFLR